MLNVEGPKREPLTTAEREARAWGEYRAWTRGSLPSQYALTEELAWRRLQDELLAIRTPAGTFSSELVIFTPEGDLDIAFEPCPDLIDFLDSEERPE
jgi:hypothetical protein